MAWRRRCLAKKGAEQQFGWNFFKLFKYMARLDIQPIAYRGSTAIISDPFYFGFLALKVPIALATSSPFSSRASPSQKMVV